MKTVYFVCTMNTYVELSPLDCDACDCDRVDQTSVGGNSINTGQICTTCCHEEYTRNNSNTKTTKSNIFIFEDPTPTRARAAKDAWALARKGNIASTRVIWMIETQQLKKSHVFKSEISSS